MNPALLLLLIILIIPLGLYVYASLKGAPYFPSFGRAIHAMQILAEIKDQDVVADLGSGDGRILLAIKDSGQELHGYEINPLVYYFSKLRIRRAPLNARNKIKVFRKNFWSADLSGYNVVIVFGIGSIMHKLESKLQQELKPGARVVSNAFRFPNWQPAKSVDGVHLYIKS